VDDWSDQDSIPGRCKDISLLRSIQTGLGDPLSLIFSWYWGHAYRILVGKPEGKRPLGRPRRRWVDNIKMDLGEIRWDGRDWIELTQDRYLWRALLNTVMNFRVP
jgi:hypothetical protein